MSEQTFQSLDEEEKLPFSPRTLILGLWRRWYIMAICVILSVAAGVGGALVLGTKTYRANTVLLFKGTGSRTDAAELRAHSSMVNMASNLEEVRQRLQISASIGALRAAIDPRVQRGTNLLNIRVVWPTPEEAASIANTIREVFVDNQRVIKRSLIGIDVRDFEERLESVKRDYDIAVAAFERFKSEHGIVNLDVEANSYAQRLANLEQLYEQATIDLQTGRLQQSGVLDEETAVLSEGLEGLSAANVKIQTLLKAIQADQANQQRTALIEQKRQEFEMAQRLYDLGLISEIEYETASNAYESQRSLMQDSEEVKERKAALNSALEERLAFIEKAREEAKSKVGQLPVLQRDYAELSAQVAFWGTQRRALEEQLAQERRKYNSNLSDFTLIREAQVPTVPATSTKKQIAITITSVGCVIGFILVLFLELIDTRIKAGADVPLKLNLPLLGVFPKFPSDQPLFPGRGESMLIEPARIVARHVRRTTPKRGARILVVSANHGEGTTMATANLAVCFGRQDERVLVIDAQVREGEHQHELRDLIMEEDERVKGLGEYLSFEEDDAQNIVWPTRVPGVECIPRIGEAVIPDLVGSNRMRELLEEVSERFSIVLIDTPPALPYVDAEVLAQWADAIIVVVKSRNERVGTLREAVDRLKVAQIPILGVILNSVDALYMEKV